MQIYIAASWTVKDEMRAARTRLEAAGHQVTSPAAPTGRCPAPPRTVHHLRSGPWVPIPARPAGEITRGEQEKLDSIVGQAYRKFGIGACDLILAAFKLAKDWT